MPFYVYVIRLKSEVIGHPKFRKANPDYIDGKPCYYVGYTSKTPEERALEHRDAVWNKRGKLFNKFAHEYFNGLTKKYQSLNPIETLEEALEKEQYIAEKFRANGCGVWWN